MLYAVRVRIGFTDEMAIPGLGTLISAWVTRHLEELPTQRESLTTHEPAADIPGETDGPEHLRGLWRFDANDELRVVLDELEAELRENAAVEWAQLIPHECDHDEPAETRPGCTPRPDEEREIGSPPPSLK